MHQPRDQGRVGRLRQLVLQCLAWLLYRAITVHRPIHLTETPDQVRHQGDDHAARTWHHGHLHIRSPRQLGQKIYGLSRAHLQHLEGEGSRRWYTNLLRQGNPIHDLHHRALPHLWSRRILGDYWYGGVELQLRYADRHPSPQPLRYFLRALANQPNKVRIQELTLLFCGVNGLVDLTHLDENGNVLTSNLGAVFCCALGDLKNKPFTGKGRKKETVGSFLTPIFEYLGIHLDQRTPDRSHSFLDERHRLVLPFLYLSLMHLFFYFSNL